MRSTSALDVPPEPPEPNPFGSVILSFEEPSNLFKSFLGHRAPGSLYWFWRAFIGFGWIFYPICTDLIWLPSGRTQPVYLQTSGMSGSALRSTRGPSGDKAGRFGGCWRPPHHVSSDTHCIFRYVADRHLHSRGGGPYRKDSGVGVVSKNEKKRADA